MKDSYNIGDLVKELNMNKETIRYYEKIGLLSEPKKNESGYRMYSNQDIEIIKFILMVKNLGFSLREIRVLLHDEILCGNMDDIKRIVDCKIDEIDVEIKELEEKKKLLNKVKETIVSKNIEGCGEIELYLKK